MTQMWRTVWPIRTISRMVVYYNACYVRRPNVKCVYL